MAEILLPDLSLQWASAGDILKPSDSKIQQGWQPEVPPRQWFNWLDNRQDEAIAHIAQHGVAVWSPDIEYQAGKSYVQGSDGIIYKAITTNENINPVGGAAGNWRVAFKDSTAPNGASVASATQARAQTDNTVFISPLQLANAFTGVGKQSLQASQGYQIFPGGFTVQWINGPVIGAGGSATVTFPIPFPNACFKVILSYNGGSPALNNLVVFTSGTPTQTSVVVYNPSSSNGTPSLVVIGN